MKVRVLPSAWADLNEIEAYVTENFGSGFAARTYRRFFRSFRLLADFPDMGRPRTDLTQRPVRFFLVDPYWIIYEPGIPLLIHRIYHSARGLSRLDLGS